MEHFDILIVKLIISYFVRKEINSRNWPTVISDIIAEFASCVFSPFLFLVFSYTFIGGLLVWNQKIVGEGFTFPKPNVLTQKGGYGYKAMANYIIKAKEWKVFAWEFSWRFPFFLRNLFCVKQTIIYRFTVIESNGCSVNPGFMKADYNKYISDFHSHMEYYFENDWGWGLCIFKEDIIITKLQHVVNGEEIDLGKLKDIENGDKFGFRVNFDKRKADILFNGKEVGNAFTEIPDEIIPVICDGGYDPQMTVSIEFLNGISRVRL